MDDRRLYPYPPPFDSASGDPRRLERRLLIESRGRLNDWLDAVDGDDALAAAEAEESVVHVTRAVFDLDPDVVTDAEALAVLDDFLGWVAGKGVAAARTPTSPPPCPECP